MNLLTICTNIGYPGVNDVLLSEYKSPLSGDGLLTSVLSE